MDYEKVRRKGLDNVSAECMLACLGYNIRKLFSSFDGKGKTDYWIVLRILNRKFQRKLI